MPNPLDYLKRLGSAATTPLIDEETIQPYQDAIDSPSLGRNPKMAQLQGFGAGALEGLRSLTSPVELAGIASLAPWGRMAGAAGRVGSRMMGAGRAVAPELGAVKSAGQIAPDLAPVGGEDLYNMGRKMVTPKDYDLYEELMRRGFGGRGQ